MPGGRPTDYGEDILVKSINYLDSCEDELRKFISQQGEGYTKYEEKLKVNLPTIEGLARYLQIHRSTLYAWQKEHEEFSDIIEQLQQKQVERLLSNGLSGDYNSTIAKVLLTKHGYTDKQEIDQKTEHSGTVGFTGINIIQPSVSNPNPEVHP
jgi:hypothetical protein